MNADRRNDFTTNTIEKDSLKIAKACGADPKPIKVAAQAVRSAYFTGFVPSPGEETPHPKKAVVAQTGYFVTGMKEPEFVSNSATCKVA